MMDFSADILADINNGVLENYLNKGTVLKQNVSNKPMLEAFDGAAGKFGGGNEYVSFAVKSGQGGGSLTGYWGDEQLSFYNPTGIKRAKFNWKEHHLGMVVSHTELKVAGINVTEGGSEDSTSTMDDSTKNNLVNLLDEKNDTLGEDYSYSLDRLIHGDGSTDAKAIAGIASILTDVPSVGITGGIGRVANTWWRHRAATVANGIAGGQGAISSASTGGGVLITFLDKEIRQLNRYKSGSTKRRWFAGAAFIDAYKAELRANGTYSNTGWSGSNTDGSMPDPKHAGIPFEWDPTMDDIGLTKRCYVIDMGKNGIRLLYMDGQRMKKHNPARPYDRLVMYNGITMTGTMIAKQLNTSAVYDIA